MPRARWNGILAKPPDPRQPDALGPAHPAAPRPVAVLPVRLELAVSPPAVDHHANGANVMRPEVDVSHRRRVEASGDSHRRATSEGAYPGRFSGFIRCRLMMAALPSRKRECPAAFAAVRQRRQPPRR